MEATEQEEKKLCSNCKRLIPAGTFVVHEAYCRRNITLCEVCDEPVPTQEMEKHHVECHTPMSCDQCGASMPRDQLEEHVEGQCPQRVVECKYCELDVKAADYDTHIDACGSRTDYCDKCNVRVMLKDMEEHKLAKCGDLKAVEFPMEPTLENLPPAYMDGYSPGNPGGISQGPLIGGEEYFFHGPGQGVLGGPPNFGMPPDYLEEGAIFYGGTRDERGREDNVQVDQQWLEEVGGVCEGEDIDRMMAQAIAMEDSRYATSQDHLFGIDDSVLREGHYANKVRVMEKQRAEQDADIARRLQSRFNREYHMQKADETLARQFNDQDAVTPIDPHHLPTAALPPDYNTVERERELEERERLVELEWEREQQRGQESERERQREEDSLLAKRLQSQEQDRLKRELERKIEETRGSRTAERETEIELGDTDDERLALKLQEEEIKKAKVEICKCRRKHGLPDTRREGSGGSQEERESESGHTQDGEFHTGHEEQFKYPQVFPAQPLSPPLAHPQDSVGDRAGYDDIPTLEPNDDSEQPRLKPIPKPRPLEEGEDKVPCQFCKESFPFQIIMGHQRHCTAAYTVGSGHERGRGRGRAVEVNLEEVLREEERERTTGGSNVLCKHCQEPFPQTLIDPHQALCDKNPDKGLKNAYQSRKNPPVAVATMTTEPTVSVPTTQAPPETHEEADMLPCEYCQASCSPHSLLSHQAVCEQRPRSLHKNTSQRSGHSRDDPGPATAGDLVSDPIPCQFCGQQIPFKNYIRHETVCRFQRHHPSPSTTSSALPQPTSSLSHPATTTPTEPKKPTKLPQQRRIAAVFPHTPRPTPYTHHPTPHTPHPTTTTVYSTLTDDQKTTLSLSHAHPTSTTATSSASVSSTHLPSEKSSDGGHLYGRGSSRMSQPFSTQGQLPQIYMYTSASPPHSVDGGVGEKRTWEESHSLPDTLNTKMQRVEVVANRHPRHHDRGATTIHTGLSSQTRRPPRDPQREVPLTAVDLPSDVIMSWTSAPVTATSNTPSFTSRASNHVPPPQSQPTPQEPSQFIGSDSTIVRPTRSDFAALQRQAVVPTPISLPTSSDAMLHPLKMATSGSSVLSNLSLIPPISSAPSKNGKTTQDKTLYNVHVNSQNTLLGTDKGSLKMMPDALIQKPMAGLGIDVAVLVPAQVQNTTITALKDSSSRKDMTLMKSPLKMKQLNIAELSEGKGKGKGVLDFEMIKITPGSPTSNISPEITGSKSLSSAVGCQDYEVSSSPATSTSSTENPPQLPASAPDYSRRDAMVSPLTTDSYSPSLDGDSSGICDGGSESSAATSTTGPLVEYTGSYVNEEGTSPTDTGEPSLHVHSIWDDGGVATCSGDAGREPPAGLETAPQMYHVDIEISQKTAGLSLSQPSPAQGSAVAPMATSMCHYPAVNSSSFTASVHTHRGDSTKRGSSGTTRTWTTVDETVPKGPTKSGSTRTQTQQSYRSPPTKNIAHQTPPSQSTRPYANGKVKTKAVVSHYPTTKPTQTALSQGSKVHSKQTTQSGNPGALPPRSNCSTGTAVRKLGTGKPNSSSPKQKQTTAPSTNSKEGPPASGPQTKKGNSISRPTPKPRKKMNPSVSQRGTSQGGKK